MTQAQPRPLLITHSGKFHCDEVFAYAVLRLALGLRAGRAGPSAAAHRKAELIETGDIVLDVGSVFDAAPDRFDHHQRGAPTAPMARPFPPPGLSGRSMASAPWPPCWRRTAATSPPPSPSELDGSCSADRRDG